jgi:hypothetical protein
MKAFPSAVVTYERLYKVQAFRKFTKVRSTLIGGHHNQGFFSNVTNPHQTLSFPM